MAGIVIVVQWARLFVTLAQRSNVETLALLFFVIFFAYFVLLSWRGTVAAARLAYFSYRARRIDRQSVELEKMQALGPTKGRPPTVAVNVLIEQEGRQGQRIEIDVADKAGSVGRLWIDGARLQFNHNAGMSSNEVLIYLVHQLNRVLERQGESRRVNIVEWETIDDESLDQYLSLVQFARNLEQYLSGGEAWPRVYLRLQDIQELQDRLSAACPALRSEAFLPEWEYGADHKLPLIPEPLGLLSLSRSEKRVDPLSSMGAATAIVLLSDLVFLIFVLFPPWVPGT